MIDHPTYFISLNEDCIAHMTLQEKRVEYILHKSNFHRLRLFVYMLKFPLAATNATAAASASASLLLLQLG